MRKVIFACVHNAGRSQMSAAFFNRYADPAKLMPFLLVRNLLMVSILKW
ncbi:MAG TPA: hypothetical protein VH079_19195 [Terriglobales bacterium]|jgi:hypothetical protein|nr:hypothetical protein [Terriglobales bacterium]